MSNLTWFVAHTRPRREKKLAVFCDREGIPWSLPCYESVRKYQRKIAVFQKPIFPGYVFLQLMPASVAQVRQCHHVANLLKVVDQETFARQVEAIMLAVREKYEVRLSPSVVVGSRVRIKSGPLRGFEGIVESRSGPAIIHLRVDFINRAAAVKIDADLLELV